MRENSIDSIAELIYEAEGVFITKTEKGSL